jgi:hypothetical protein
MEEEKMVEVEVKNVVDEGAVAVEEIVPTPEGAAFAEAVAAEAVAAEAEAKKGESKKDKPSTTIKDALKQAESFAQTLAEALQGRGNVVMVRVNDEALAHLDMLVEAEVTKSRSGSAAFLINEGIQANEALFKRISAITDQIAELREQLRQEVKLPSQAPKAEIKEEA